MNKTVELKTDVLMESMRGSDGLDLFLCVFAFIFIAYVFSDLVDRWLN